MSSADLAVRPAPHQDAALRRTRYPGAFGRLVRGELRLVFGRRRNQALLVVLGVVPVIIGVAVKVSAPPPGEGPPFLTAVTGNGVFLVFTALTVCLPLFLPLVVGVVSGDSIAGEAGSGTLRYLLTVPVTRGRLLAAKSLGVLAHVGAAVLTIAVVGLVTGGLLFGLGPVTLLSGDTVSLAEGLFRALCVAVYVVVALAGLAAAGMFISTLTENAVAAMATTIGFSIANLVLDQVPQLGRLRSGLLTHHWLGFGELLRSQVDVGQLIGWSAVHLAYVVVFLALAHARLQSKDVTS